MPNKSLGRGLASLLGSSDDSDLDEIMESESLTAEGLAGILGDDEQKVLQVSPEDIIPNPQQPRRNFSPESLQDLVSSIRQHGILQPLIVTEISKGRYELIAGERRLRAAKILKLKKVPVIVRSASLLQKLELSLIENLQREDLNIVDRALAYKKLADEFSMSHEEIARKVGKSRPVITNTIRVLGLPETVQRLIVEGKLPEAYAVFIMTIPDKEKQVEVAQEAAEKKMSRADLDMLVRKYIPKGKARTGKAAVKVDPQIKSYTERLTSLFKTNVKINKKGSTSWTISIEAYSREELTAIVEKILKLDRLD